MATWRELISEEAKRVGDNTVIETVAMAGRPPGVYKHEDPLDVEFDDGVGLSEGRPFFAWSANRVYFPVVYDGSEWVGSVPRNPDPDSLEEPTHFGGE